MIVKTESASKRPQREEPCVIKEGDMEMSRTELKGFKIPPKTSVRVVINPSSISTFMTDNFGDIIFSINLDDLSSSKMVDEPNCIKLTNDKDHSVRKLCAMEFGALSMKDQIISWTKNIDLFKTCN